MQTTTIETLFGGQWQPIHDDACLFRVYEADTTFYIEQAHHPYNRLWDHVALLPQAAPPSKFGRWLLQHRPLWPRMQVDLLCLGDITGVMNRQRPTSLSWWSDMGHLFERAPWEAVYQVEYALIRHYRPCLNEHYNQGPGRTPLPPEYRPFPENSYGGPAVP